MQLYRPVREFCDFKIKNNAKMSACNAAKKKPINYKDYKVLFIFFLNLNRWIDNTLNLIYSTIYLVNSHT